MRTLVKWLPAFGSFALAAGLEVSVIEIPWVGYSLMGLGVLLLLIPLWSVIKRHSNRKNVLMELVSFIPEGETIREKCYDQKRATPKREAELWAEKVAQYLDTKGSHYRLIFFSSDGLGTAKIPPMYSHDHKIVALFLSYRLMRIQQFLEEFRTNP